MDPYRVIKVFETADGARFDKEPKALEHVADECREVLSLKLKPLLGPLTHNDIFRAVMCLIPDAAGAKELAKALSSKFHEHQEDFS